MNIDLRPVQTSQSPLRIASAADEAYFPGLLVTVTSAAWFADMERGIEITVLDGGLSDPSRARLTRVVHRIRPDAQVNFLRVDRAALGGFKDNGLKSPMTYARLLLPKFILAPRIVYLDSDMLVVGDLAPLMDLPDGSAVVHAAPDPAHPNLAEDCPWLPPREAAALPYFNCGLLSLDLDAWRAGRVAEACFELLRRDGVRCRYWDQTVINYILRGRIGALGGQWNRLCSEFRVGDSTEQTRVIHCLAPEKPWQHTNDTEAHRLWHLFAGEVAGLKFGDVRFSYRTDSIRLRARDALSAPISWWFSVKAHFRPADFVTAALTMLDCLRVDQFPYRKLSAPQ